MSKKETLLDCLTCKICHHQYHDPILLPCNQMICSRHIYIEANDDIFKCKFCTKGHNITLNGFPKIEIFDKILNISHEYVHRDLVSDSNHHKAKKFCEKLEKSIEKCELLSRDPIFYIEEYFSNLKFDLDLNREESLKRIEDNYLRLLDCLDRAEKTCVSNINLNDLNEFNKSIRLAKEKLNECVKLSNEKEIINLKNWHDFIYKVETHFLNVEHMIEKYQSKLLSNKKYTYVSNKISMGDLIISANNIQYESRLNTNFRLELKNLKSLRSEGIRVLEQYKVVDNIPWVIAACIRDNQTFDPQLIFYVAPDFERDHVKKRNEIKAKISLYFLDNNNFISNFLFIDPKEFIIKQLNGSIYGFDLKMVTNENYNLYNKVNDSIRIQLNIAVF